MTAKALRLQLKVIPGATKTGIEWYGDKLKIKVNAVAERGRANDAVLAMLAARLDLPLSKLRLVSGHTTALKMVEIEGLSQADLLSRIPR